MRALLKCIHFETGNILEDGKMLSDSSEGGMVFFFTIVVPNTGSNSSDYGVRIRNASQLQSDVSGA